MSTDFLSLPVDPQSAERLAAQGLRLGLVDPSDSEAVGHWLQADSRGFHDSRATPESIEAQARGLAYRRTTGVWDDSGADAASPVATVSTWPAQLTVPGETSVTGWAISSVTVAPTHRRKGIARALLEAELRTAAELKIPLAMLTVSEATIYARYGFAPAAMAASWKIDTRRAKWAGPYGSGRVQFLPLEQLRVEAPALIERVRLRVPGEIEHWDHLWDRMFGLSGDDKERAKNLRAVRYDDGSGVAQGFAIYVFTDQERNFAAHTLDVHYLVAATDDAYAGLWRYLLEMDLVGEVTAPLRSVDEPFYWQISDQRAASKTREGDHLWVRILDVKAALEARRYSTGGRIVLEVDDPLGFAAGRVLVDIADDGTATVTQLDGESPDGESPDGVAALALSVNELGALYLGGVSASTLVRSGRIAELRAGSADAVDASFRSAVAPWLSIWF